MWAVGSGSVWVLGAWLACVPPAVEESLPHRLELADVVQLPGPGYGGPVQLALSPDGRWLTYLLGAHDSLERQLHARELATGATRIAVEPPGGVVPESEMSLEEQLRRERMRERGLGVTRYAWAAEADVLLVPIGPKLYVQDGVEGDLRLLVEAGDHPLLDPQLSRDGAHVAYVQDDELYVVASAGGTPAQITRGARGTGRSHGLAEYIAQEEMGRHHGFWWAPAGERLAYTEIDETHIPVWRIVHEGRDAPSWEDHRYPFAGTENARVGLFVVGRAGGEPVEVDLTAGGAVQPEYLARVHWLDDDTLVVAVQDRAQQRLDLLRADVSSGRTQVLLTERSEVWVNLHDLFRTLEQSPGAFLWGTERTGFQHLVRVDADGTQTPLTAGEWVVEAVAGVDEDLGEVYVFGTRDGALQRHLYRVALDRLVEPERLTPMGGTHGGLLDVKGRRIVDHWSSVGTAPELLIRSLDGDDEPQVVHRSDDPRLATMALDPPELVRVPTRDGAAILDAAVYRPAGDGPWPVIVSVYGGPHAQRVADRWDLAGDLRAQFLRQQGFLVLKVDNRGAARRGLAFEGALRHDMGHVEVRDQADAVRWAVDQGWGDPARVGIYGWSYGGYMAAMALMRAPETFHVAVAGAPVTHWDGYDTHYTERYMGTPQSNPEGYAVSSVMHHVDGLQGDLMLVHGAIDENVHFRHTARLVQALVRAGKPYELLMFPDERHMPRRAEDRLYLERRVVDFLVEGLSRR